MTGGTPDAECEVLGQWLNRIDSRWRIDPENPLTEPSTRYLPPADADDGDKRFRERLRTARRAARPLQRKLAAQRRYGVLMVFQSLDAGGKDGAIRQVLRGLDPGGVRAVSFKRPTRRELDHDFLWRTTTALPARGEIVAFNRSHYEEVLAVRVHPEMLEAQYNGPPPDAPSLWAERFRAIREHERHLANARIVVLKFWLNVSPARQAERFLQRLEDAKRQWKFSREDLKTASFRSDFDRAITETMNVTSRPWAPWFCIPADNRWYLRWQIADILHQTLQILPVDWPEPEEDLSDEERERLAADLRARIGETDEENPSAG